MPKYSLCMSNPIPAAPLRDNAPAAAVDVDDGGRLVGDGLHHRHHLFVLAVAVLHEGVDHVLVLLGRFPPTLLCQSLGLRRYTVLHSHQAEKGGMTGVKPVDDF